MMLSLAGLIIGLILLIYWAMRGMHLLIAAPLAALILALTSNIPVFDIASSESTPFVQAYMDGFTGFFKTWFFMFLLGAIFGKAMEASGAADSLASWIIQRVGIGHGALAIVIACAVLTYGGVSVFIVAFCVYAMAVKLFKEANLPRRFIPAVMAFGSVTFTMTSAGSPEIQNWIPMQYLGTSPYAGWPVSIIVAVFMAMLGYLWMRKMITQAMINGERFENRASDQTHSGFETIAHPFKSLLPLLAVLAGTFFLHQSLGTAALMIALAGGIAVTYLFHFRTFNKLAVPFTEGASGALIALANTCAVVGFGAVAKMTPAFIAVVNQITALPGGGLVGAAIAVAIICGLTGSASGGQSIALPLLAPLYIGPEVSSDQRINPDALHRVVAIASGGLDSLPHNGYVVTLIRSICGETHQAAYGPLAVLTVVVPLLGTVLAIVLFAFG